MLHEKEIVIRGAAADLPLVKGPLQVPRLGVGKAP
jgi:hypothetical protein